MELKKNIDEDQIMGIVDNEGFWYALSDGGYLNPEEILKNKEDIKRVKNAIKIIREFQYSLPQL